MLVQCICMFAGEVEHEKNKAWEWQCESSLVYGIINRRQECPAVGNHQRVVMVSVAQQVYW